jgi:hypothetical protein
LNHSLGIGALIYIMEKLVLIDDDDDDDDEANDDVSKYAQNG